MKNRIAEYFDDEPLPLIKLGFGLGLGWFTAASLVQAISWLVVNISKSLL